ncbi:MAG: peptidase M48 Ste24p, partial [Pseudorhodoplanes sp.]
AALVQYAGGRDPGPLALPAPDDNETQGEGGKPFLPDTPPLDQDAGPWGSRPEESPAPRGPWGPRSS